jgi:hypothetical protein
MHTIKRAETRSVSIAAPPHAVHSYLADGANLPAWAPGFAPAVRADGTSWIVAAAAGEFRVDVIAESGPRTVDVVSADDHARGLFARVLPSGDGSELLFSLLFAPDTPERDVEAQMVTLEAELDAVRGACE